jgi:glycosyltransferase involved in cell wall biosynthesis
MKILQITNKFPYPPKDGGSRATFNLIKGFYELNQEVTVLAMNTSKHFIDIQTLPDDLKKSAQFIPFNINTKISYVKILINLLFSSYPYNLVRFKSRKFSKKICEILKKQDFDIIQLEGLALAFYVPVIRKFSGAKIIMRAHNAEFKIWEGITSYYKYGIKKFLTKILCRRLKNFELRNLNLYDAIVPISSIDLEIFKKAGINKPMFYAPCGVDFVRPDTKQLNQIYPTLFSIGALDWIPNQKGLLWFLENVWRTLKVNLPKLRFYVAGRNAPTWLIRKMRKEQVIFTGEVDDAYHFMSLNTIMVVPLFTAGGIRVKIIEGMALGKVIVSTTTGVEGIYATHEKNIIIANNKYEFSDQIERLISDIKLQNRISKEAQKYIRKKFDNLAITSSVLTFYKSLLNDL